MIKKLKIKFVAIVALLLVFVFAIVLFTLNLSMRGADSKRTTELLNVVVQFDGFPADIKQPDTPQSSKPGETDSHPPSNMRFERLFYAKIDTAGNIVELNTEMMFGFFQQEALGYVESALARNKSTGSLDNFQYIVAEKDYGQIVVFAEKSVETKLLGQLMNTSLWVVGGSSVVLLVLAFFLANWMIRPVQQSFDRQRRFISDAGHELKTPVTIIAANADLAETELGQNKWIDGIKHQTKRMSGLINDLLDLAKSDEQNASGPVARFNFSDLVSTVVLEFESRAYEEQKELKEKIEPSIYLDGNEPRIRQLISILIDNAFSHSAPGSAIEVSAEPAGSKVVLQVGNTGSAIKQEDETQIFERFYRSDSSRSRATGGYGLGLSIAKSIVDEHKGSISAQTQNGKTVFRVKL